MLLPKCRNGYNLLNRFVHGIHTSVELLRCTPTVVFSGQSAIARVAIDGDTKSCTKPQRWLHER
jgi:hypothetical protein